jgi:hypothetical protein
VIRQSFFIYFTKRRQRTEPSGVIDFGLALAGKSSVQDFNPTIQTWLIHFDNECLPPPPISILPNSKAVCTAQGSGGLLFNWHLDLDII